MDAIGGGGGLISVPALLAVGLPPHLALGTNKGQSVFGSFAALSRYAHAGLIDREAARVAFPLAIAGSAAGAALAFTIRPEVLRPVVLVLLVAAGVALLTIRAAPGSPEAVANGPRSVRRADLIWAVAALGVGAYDGFFGPGTGTFLILILVGWLHRPLSRATADAKIVNFGSNLAAVAYFGSRGAIAWHIALPMAAAQLLGGFLGAHLAVRRGDRFIKVVVLCVVIALIVKIGRDLLQGSSHS
jgi:uncharacterized protein